MNNKLETYVEEFLNSIRSIMAKSTVESYGIDLRKFCRFLGEKEMTSANIQDFLNQVIASNSSKHRFKSSISQFNKYLIMKDLMIKDHTIGVKVPKIEQKNYDILSKEDEEKIYEYIIRESKNPVRDNTICKIMSNTGCRIIEVLNLRRMDIDLENLSINILNSKGNKSRRVYINDELREQLVTYFNFWESKNNDNEELLFPITYVTWNSKVKKIFEKLFPNKKITSHSWRRSYASDLNKKNIPTSKICDILGHSDINTTQRYIQNLDDDKKDIMINNI